MKDVHTCYLNRYSQTKPKARRGGDHKPSDVIYPKGTNCLESERRPPQSNTLVSGVCAFAHELGLARVNFLKRRNDDGFT